ncbi:MAG TPA: hypothetical protein VG326_10765 [Tepidisphaeraceae bacterium]|jgi:hypothetical protein|nr:hypothetical protein [Tepidisphaeraceae bacterium]
MASEQMTPSSFIDDNRRQRDENTSKFPACNCDNYDNAAKAAHLTATR